MEDSCVSSPNQLPLESYYCQRYLGCVLPAIQLWTTNQTRWLLSVRYCINSAFHFPPLNSLIKWVSVGCSFFQEDLDDALVLLPVSEVWQKRSLHRELCPLQCRVGLLSCGSFFFCLRKSLFLLCFGRIIFQDTEL